MPDTSKARKSRQPARRRKRKPTPKEIIKSNWQDAIRQRLANVPWERFLGELDQ